MDDAKRRYVLKLPADFGPVSQEQGDALTEYLRRWRAGEVPVLVLPPGAELVCLDDQVDLLVEENSRLRSIFTQDFCADNQAARLAYEQGWAEALEQARGVVCRLMGDAPDIDMVAVLLGLGDLRGRIRKEAAGG
jgi:hypothetical protein